MKKLFLGLILYIFLLFLAALNGCGSVGLEAQTYLEGAKACRVQSIIATYPDSFTQEEIDQANRDLDYSVQQWNSAMGFEIFQIGGDKNIVNLSITEDSEGLEEWGTGTTSKPRDGSCGCSILIDKNALNNDGSIPFSVPGIDGSWAVWAHEEGHCLGLWHDTENIKSVMHVPTYSNSNITDEMLQLVNENLEN